MPKRQKREQQHRGQQTARRRSYTAGGYTPAEKYKPGFPMNLVTNARLFYIVGVFVILSMVITAILVNTDDRGDDIPNPTPTPLQSTAGSPSPDASTTPAASPSPAKTFSKAEDVIDEQTKNYTAVIKTAKGDVELKLYADKAPNTVNSFVFLVRNGFFDGITFHRVVANFVVQGGDPSGTGSGGPGYQTNDEPNDVRNTRGTLSMAKASGATAFGSQFFINLKDNPSLDFDNPSANKFYPFAEVTKGMDVVDKIAQGDVIQKIEVFETAK